MPTPSTILSLAPGAAYLAGNAIAKGQLFPTNKVNPILPQQIYAVYFILKKIHTLDPTNSALVPCCNYLWELMGRWGVKAQALSGGGGSVAPITPGTGYVYYVLNDTITADSSTYQSSLLVGGRDLGSITVNDQQFMLDRDFTFNNVTGAITFTTISLFIDDDISIPFNRLV